MKLLKYREAEDLSSLFWDEGELEEVGRLSGRERGGGKDTFWHNEADHKNSLERDDCNYCRERSHMTYI